MSYQVYKTYLQKAQEQEKAGQPDNARMLYLHAAKSLLAVAQNNTAQVRKDQLRDVERLYEKAKSFGPDGKKTDSQKPAAPRKIEDGADFVPAIVPDVSFSDIAGLEEVKREIRERVIQPMNSPEIYKIFKIKPGGGILMFGLPGTGKTMVARATAHEVNAPFYLINSSDIKSKWVGSTERNIASLFNQARQEKTAVLFFDEFDGLGGKADDSSDSTRGMLAELKSQMDGFDKNPDTNILMIAATNHPEDIDTAFLRSGRFSRMMYIPLPDEAARDFLLHQQLKGIPMEDDVDIPEMVRLTQGFSGADIVQFCDQIKIRAATRSDRIGRVSNMTQQDVDEVKEGMRSSVIRSDIEKMKEFMHKNGFKIPDRM